MGKKYEYAMLIFITIWLYPYSMVLMAKELPVIWQDIVVAIDERGDEQIAQDIHL
jgi:hypothetical protein